MASKNLLPHFSRGKKHIYLPSFRLTFLRTPFLPPTFAKFIVPLNFNKLDIRDYLFSAYGVRVLKVRSYVQQMRVQSDQMGRKYRPKSIKKMTVEMDKPFVWPEEPEDFSTWDKETFDQVQEEQENFSEDMTLMRAEKQRRPPGKKHRLTVAEQAKALLSGKEKWRPTWEALGGEQSDLDVVQKTRSQAR